MNNAAWLKFRFTPDFFFPPRSASCPFLPAVLYALNRAISIKVIMLLSLCLPGLYWNSVVKMVS